MVVLLMSSFCMTTDLGEMNETCMQIMFAFLSWLRGCSQNLDLNWYLILFLYQTYCPSVRDMDVF